ncbi:MAG: ABC transporter permease subunit [Brevinema sp.]
MKYPVYFKNKKLLAFFFLLPQLVIIGVFFIYPAIQSVIMSIFLEDTFGLSKKFVGLTIYWNILTDSVYYEIIINSFLLSFFIVVLSIIPAMIMALAVHHVKIGKRFFQTVLILPQVIAPAVAGVLWLFLFNPSSGIIVVFFESIGINWNHALNGSQALVLVILISIWNHIGYNFIFISSALYNLPKSVLEASLMDSPSPWNRFWKVKLPLLSPTMIYLIIMNIVYAFFNTFSIIDITTKGGPGRVTTTMAYQIYLDGFLSSHFSNSAAQSVLILFIVSFLIWIQYKLTSGKIHYH